MAATEDDGRILWRNLHILATVARHQKPLRASVVSGGGGGIATGNH